MRPFIPGRPMHLGYWYRGKAVDKNIVPPPPRSPNSHPAVQTAVSALEKVAGGLAKSFNAAAVSTGAKSLHRIGRASKVFTVLTTLKISACACMVLSLRPGIPYREIGIDLAVDLASFPVDRTELALPPARDVMGCVGLSGIPLCGTTEAYSRPTSAAYTKPEGKVGAISLDDTIWNLTLGIVDPVGGSHSNTEDFLAFWYIHLDE
ncbi:hypothetical protein DL771_002965 [Monosporascus sp. 5C6A]|nr:hypothetical protein DL771_002965 [Monosporascus sp. 5C6A]